MKLRKLVTFNVNCKYSKINFVIPKLMSLNVALLLFHLEKITNEKGLGFSFLCHTQQQQKLHTVSYFIFSSFFTSFFLLSNFLFMIIKEKSFPFFITNKQHTVRQWQANKIMIIFIYFFADGCFLCCYSKENETYIIFGFWLYCGERNFRSETNNQFLYSLYFLTCF